MVEATSLMYGIYYFDFPTSINDSLGEYIVGIFSPQENIRSTGRISYGPPATVEGQSTVLTITGPIRGFVSPDNPAGALAQSSPGLRGGISDNKVFGKVQDEDLSGVVTPEEFSGHINDNSISGDTYGLDLP